MSFWLEDNDHSPPIQYRAPRRKSASGVVVVHTAENVPDHVGFDGGAEAVARWIAGRSDFGSYHTIVDSDSILPLVAPWNEAFHDATGSNPHSFGISVATRADIWPLAPAEWRDGAIYNLAVAASTYATWLQRERGIIVPPQRITRAESELLTPGFISHAERDPKRRTDPGKYFPWDQFLHTYADIRRGMPTPPRPTIPQKGFVDVKLPVLSMGDRGGTVRSLQTLLVVKAGQSIAIDGIFGSRTLDAVKNVQRFFRLNVDGIVGGQTWPTLFF